MIADVSHRKMLHIRFLCPFAKCAPPNGTLQKPPFYLSHFQGVTTAFKQTLFALQTSLVCTSIKPCLQPKQALFEKRRNNCWNSIHPPCRLGAVCMQRK